MVKSGLYLEEAYVKSSVFPLVCLSPAMTIALLLCTAYEIALSSCTPNVDYGWKEFNCLMLLFWTEYRCDYLSQKDRLNIDLFLFKNCPSSSKLGA